MTSDKDRDKAVFRVLGLSTVLVLGAWIALLVFSLLSQGCYLSHARVPEQEQEQDASTPLDDAGVRDDGGTSMGEPDSGPDLRCLDASTPASIELCQCISAGRCP